MLAREIIRRVREIQVRTGRQVADVLAGEYVSVFKGRGIEFDEVRPYVPGDDVSASQDYGSGTRSKRESTAELCALLAFSATHTDDKVGLTLFHSGIEKYIPPRK